MTGLELTVFAKLVKMLGKWWRDKAKSETKSETKSEIKENITTGITQTHEIGDNLADTLKRLSQDQKEIEWYRALGRALPAAADRYYAKNSASIRVLATRRELSDFDVGILGLYGEHGEISPNEAWSFNSAFEDVFGRLRGEVAHQDDTLDRLYRRATEPPHTSN